MASTQRHVARLIESVRAWGGRDWAFVGLCLLAIGVLLAGFAAARFATPASDSSQIAIRTNALGQTETGQVVTETRDGRVRTLVRWRKRGGGTVTQRLAGGARTIKEGSGTVTVEGGRVAVVRRGETVIRVQTVTRGETVQQVNTVHDTVIVPGPTRTQTVTQIVTGPPETVTQVVTETTVVTETVKDKPGNGPPGP